MNKKVCILYTGGTIGMVPTEDGYAPKKGYFRSLLDDISQLRHEDMPTWDLVEFDPLLDSSDISVDEWNVIGSAIAARYDKYDGFVILHGTDTMAYTASALSCMLEGLGKPVVMTGSQIPMCEVRSDGRDNIINSMMIASQGVANEVSIYFAGKLIQDAGLKGYTVGGAQVSEKHSGFVINKGGATASEIAFLIRRVQEQVKKAYGVTMHPEVRFVGFDESEVTR